MSLTELSVVSFIVCEMGLVVQDGFDVTCDMISNSLSLFKHASKYIRRIAKEQDEHAKNLSGLMNHFEEDLRKGSALLLWIIFTHFILLQLLLNTSFLCNGYCKTCSRRLNTCQVAV